MSDYNTIVERLEKDFVLTKRAKPVKRVVEFRNYIDKSGFLGVTKNKETEYQEYFHHWVGDWIKHEYEMEDEVDG